MVSPDAVLDVLRTIDDPEMPISIVDLGIVDSVRSATSNSAPAETGARVCIDLLPTFVGCPALEAIAQEVRRRVGAMPGVAEVDLHYRFDPPWSVDRITAAGRTALRAVGITVPETGEHAEPVCPFCGSPAVQRENAFGPTRCRMIYYCPRCQNPFEHMKRVPLTCLRVVGDGHIKGVPVPIGVKKSCEEDLVMSHPLFERHQKILQDAVAAIRSRTYWSAYPEIPSGKIYGENAKADGQAAFEARLNQPFVIDQPGTVSSVGGEVSPYGMELGITYPKADLNVLLKAATAALPAWRDASIEARVGVCLEILARLNKRSFEMAFAVMHTTGQAFMMAFQAGGPHAQDRGLEAVAYAYEEMKRVPEHVTWEKPGKGEPIRLQKRFRIVPRGIGVVVGVSTFATWNAYPALFADLVTGNAVVVKPHPGAILPLALTVVVARDVLKENGFDPNLVTLAADTGAAPVTKELVCRPEVALVDFTGSTAFGNWIENNARQARVFTEKAGVNAVIVDSAADLKAVVRNLSFSVSLYSGQMCTTSQNIYVPKNGIMVGGQRVGFDEFARALAGGVDQLLADPARAVELLGAIQNEATLKRLEAAPSEGGEVVLPSKALTHAQFPQARIRTPLILKVRADQDRVYQREMFGPIVYLIATEDTDDSIARATYGAREHGAITFSIYSTDPKVLARAEHEATDAGAAVSCNLTGDVYVNQSAAFSDFHVSGANPAGNATLTDSAYVANRFRVVQSRIPSVAGAAAAAK
jgi:phenylacetic acid degradation protein paaN/phenylacetate-CoA oxygenase PaaJ subunit